MILVGNHNAYKGRSGNGIFDLENSRECSCALHFHFNAIVIPHMIMHRTLCRVNRIGLCSDICRHRLGMRSPVVENLRNMLYILCLFRQT